MSNLDQAKTEVERENVTPKTALGEKWMKQKIKKDQKVPKNAKNFVEAQSKEPKQESSIKLTSCNRLLFSPIG